jgi:flagellar biosynthesis/type III secretory pathway chaperone
MPDNGRVSELVMVTSRLITLMDQEVEFLKEVRPERLAELQDDKNKLVHAYELAMEQLSENPTLFASVAPPVREEVVAATQRLQQAMRRNLRALEAAREVNARLMQKIVEAASIEQGKGKAYSSTGAAPRIDAQDATPLAMDQRL